MRASTQKLTTAAVCTALAVIMCAMTAYLPLSFMPLFLAAFCIFLACKRGSLAYGLLCAAATIGLMFLMSGLSAKWLALVLVFAPYGVLTYFMHKFNYFKVKSGILRGAVMLVFFNVTVGVVYIVTMRVVGVGIDGLDLAEWANMLGGYVVLAVLATAILMPLDFIFSTLSIVVLKKIPVPVTRLKKPPISDVKNEDKASDTANDKVEYDIFGYEINGAHGDKENDKEQSENINNDDNNDI